VKRCLPLIAALALVPAGSARADVTAGTEITSSGAVTATLSWQAGEGPVNTTLTITRSGAVAFSRPIPDICDAFCVRDSDDPDGFQTADLDGDGEPEVVVFGDNADRQDGDEGVGIFFWDAAAGSYREFFNHFPFVSSAHHHGKLQIVGEDTRFSGLRPENATPPARVFEYAAGPKLVDVSRTDGRAEIRADIRDRASEIKEMGTAPVAVNRAQAIAYVADEYLLGHRALARRQLDRLIAQRSLGTPKSAAAFRRRLLSELHRFGYTA
jgi:hypothetical protein